MVEDDLPAGFDYEVRALGFDHNEKRRNLDLIFTVLQKKYPGGKICVYYASQTGTAESFAKQLQREGADRGFEIHVIDLEDIQVEQLVDESSRDEVTGVAKAVFVAATYGEGEPTDNAAVFVQAMKEKANICGIHVDEEEKKDPDVNPSELCLSGLEYCVFGLGNRQYEHFNAMGKFFDYALQRAGGKRILQIGLGDDDNDLEGDFESWKDKQLWPALTTLYVKDESLLAKKDAKSVMLPDCPFVVEYVKSSDVNGNNIPLDHVHGSSRHYFTAVECPVSVVRELRTANDAGSTVHVEIDISNAKDLRYQTADNFGVLPKNVEQHVVDVAQALKYDLDAIFTVEAAPDHEWQGAPFPMPISVRECLTRYCDLTCSPRRSNLKLLAAYARDPIDKKALSRMATIEGRKEYKEKVLEQMVGIVDLLKLCPSIQMPLEHFLSVCPRLVPRFYTISSSSSVYPRSVHLTVTVTKAPRKDGSLFRGLCSNYLAELQPNRDKVLVFNRESTFRLPTDTTKPILMIGPGTGIAPMRALLQERLHQRKSLGLSVGRNILYFGCRKRSQDFLYEQELDGFQKEGILDKLRVAFSREQTEKVYVQDLLKQDAIETWQLIHEQGAWIYVCGGVKMGHDVSDVLHTICETEGGMSEEDARQYLSTLANSHRYVQELWA